MAPTVLVIGCPEWRGLAICTEEWASQALCVPILGKVWLGGNVVNWQLGQFKSWCGPLEGYTREGRCWFLDLWTFTL